MKAIDEFRARPGLRLRDKDAKSDSKPDRELLDKMLDDISDLQEMLYAERKRKLLIVLQGTDTSGKDGTVRHLFSKINPMGLRAVGFRAPTEIEAAHDFLWRIHREVPKAGEIAVFNRSHYEDVLITRVHGWIDDAECARRYQQIRAFEQMLTETGTTIVKCFLHISKDEQKDRLEQRIGDPQKHWKFDAQDLAERKFWNEYQRVYEAAIAATATPANPWYIVPANSKTHRNLMVAEILRAVFAQLKPEYPPPKPELAKLVVE